MKLFLHDFLARSRANGPGERAVVWVQGCPHRCSGCWNSDSLIFDRRQPTLISKLVDRIVAIGGLEGVTFSGGEPFSQAAALAELARQLRTHLGDSFSVVCFTGHTLEKLRRGATTHPEWEDLLQEIDLLVDGPYVEHLRLEDHPLRGSSNQRLHFLSDRIREEEVGPSLAEFTLGTDGSVSQTGFPQLLDAADVFAAVQELAGGGESC